MQVPLSLQLRHLFAVLLLRGGLGNLPGNLSRSFTRRAGENEKRIGWKQATEFNKEVFVICRTSSFLIRTREGALPSKLFRQALANRCVTLVAAVQNFDDIQRGRALALSG